MVGSAPTTNLKSSPIKEGDHLIKAALEGVSINFGGS